MKQYVKDLDGNLIEVIDLPDRFRQVAGFIRLMHEDPGALSAGFIAQRRKYWKDLFQKLAALRTTSDNGSSPV